MECAEVLESSGTVVDSAGMSWKVADNSGTWQLRFDQ